jgi:hypothetical protein
METTLVIALISLVFAAGMAVIAWRLVQEDRRRSDARVAQLVSDLNRDPDAEPEFTPRTPDDRPRAAGVEAAPSVISRPVRQAIVPPAPTREEPRAEQPRTVEWRDVEPVSLFQFDGPDDRPSEGERLFADVRTSPGTAPRFLLLGGGALLVALGIAIFPALFSGDGNTPDHASPTAPAASRGASTASLELLSLAHARRGQDLIVKGLVRNPSTGVAHERLNAVVFFFDREGGFVTSARAPLDFGALAPGDESPFQIALPAPSGVSRYRISFRRDEGGVVPHVDRRTAEASAGDQRLVNAAARASTR